MGRTALVIVPHADDAAAFCGGTLAKLAAAGWRVVIVRVTDDSKDSLHLSTSETIQRNHDELREAAEILGAAEVIDLGFETDTLGDASELELRESFVRLIRQHRPYAVFGFDPFGLYEGNLDHVATARAVEEAFWTACFDKHYPGHLAVGLEPFAVCERWYFARRLPEVTHYEDVTEFLERKIDAFCAHRTMVANLVNMTALQVDTWGRRVPLLETARAGDPRPFLAAGIEAQAEEHARAAGFAADRRAEAFRLVRFGRWERLFQETSEPLPGIEPGPERASLDRLPKDRS